MSANWRSYKFQQIVGIPILTGVLAKQGMCSCSFVAQGAQRCITPFAQDPGQLSWALMYPRENA